MKKACSLAAACVYVRLLVLAVSKKDFKAMRTEVNFPTADGLDGRTRHALMKLQNAGFLSLLECSSFVISWRVRLGAFETIGGVIAQGKEATIHHAFGGAPRRIMRSF